MFLIGDMTYLNEELKYTKNKNKKKMILKELKKAKKKALVLDNL